MLVALQQPVAAQDEVAAGEHLQEKEMYQGQYVVRFCLMNEEHNILKGLTAYLLQKPVECLEEHR